MREVRERLLQRKNGNYGEGEGLVLINEVLMEEYLYSVVPSEMPASYPAESLKAQAVCARTYGYLHLMRPGYGNLGAMWTTASVIRCITILWKMWRLQSGEGDGRNAAFV